MCGIHTVGLCEGLALAESQGLDPNLILKVCSTGLGGSAALSVLGPRVIGGDLNTGFMIKHMAKDLKLARTVAKKNGQELPCTEITEDQFISALDKGRGEMGTQAVSQNYLTNRPQKEQGSDK